MLYSAVCKSAASANDALRESNNSDKSSLAAAKTQQSSHKAEKIKFETTTNADPQERHNHSSTQSIWKTNNMTVNSTRNNDSAKNITSTKSSGSCNKNDAADVSGNKTSIFNDENKLNREINNANALPAPKLILFPRSNVSIGWQATERKWNVGVGMENVGNTCYINSTLQALFHVPSLANWLMSDSALMDRHESPDTSCIIHAMAKTLQESQSSQSAIKPLYVYSKLKSICKHLVMGRQEDAHEFLRYLVEAMENSYLSRFPDFKQLDQYSKETTPLNQIFGGYLKSAVRCLACKHVSVTFLHFQDLLLDIDEADDVSQALQSYFAAERLEDIGYKCQACNKEVPATKQFSLERAPIALCIQLKRFSMFGAKINKHVKINTRLDLKKFTALKSPNEQLSYRLTSMVTHLGDSQQRGHYTAVGSTTSGAYYYYNDSIVRPISRENVCNTNAYIMFYELDTRPLKNDVRIQVKGGAKATSKVSAHHDRTSARPTKRKGHAIKGKQRTIRTQLPPTVSLVH